MSRLLLGLAVAVAGCGRFGFDAPADGGLGAACDSDLDCGPERVCVADGGCLVADGGACTLPADCASGSCDASSRCAAARCDDGIRNGPETGTDCGGGCPGCAGGVACAQAADCLSSYCRASACEDRVVFISPQGSDAGAGTFTAPLRSFPVALARLAPGYTLLLMDGLYNTAAGTGLLTIDCSVGSTACGGAPCPSGTPAEPIAVRAVNERLPVLKVEVTDAAAPVSLVGCSSWRIEGLRCQNHDDPLSAGDTTGSVVYVEDSSDVVLRRMLVGDTNRYDQGYGIGTNAGSGVLIEENEISHFHTVGISIYLTANVVLRRNYLNGVSFPDLPAFSTSCPERGDTGIDLNGAVDVVAENNIIENACKGFELSPSSSTRAAPNQLDGTSLIGNIVAGASDKAFEIRSDCGGDDPCTDLTKVLQDVRVVDCVAIGSDRGFDDEGTINTRFEHCSALDPGTVGFYAHLGNVNTGLANATSHIVGSLAFNAVPGGIGMRVDTLADWSIVDSNASGFGDPYLPSAGDPHLSNAGTADPLLGGCRVYIPPSSPMRAAGPAGSDIGANVVYRSQDGVLTAEPLWNPLTGAFSCGAAVPGANVPPALCCSNVHERLNVGVGGCPIP